MKETIGAKSPQRIQISEVIRRELASVLNEVHGISYSYRYWGIILEKYITSVLTLKKVLENDEDIAKADKYPMNSHSFVNYSDRVKLDIKKFIKLWQTRSDWNALTEVLRENNHLKIGFPSVNAVEAMPGVELPKLHFYVTGLSGMSKRKRIIEISKKYNDSFLKNSVYRIPKVFVEFFNKINEKIPMCQPDQKTFHVHNIRTLYDQFLVALYVENGAKLIWYQHGSHYGEYNHEYLHHLEHSLADEYRTWGWQIKEKDVPWNAYRLEKFRQEYDGYNKNVKNDLLVIYPKMYEKYKNHCLVATEKLLGNLNFNKYNNLLARPRPLHSKHGHEAELDFITHEKVRISSGLHPIAKEVAESRLIVQLNVPGTNFLECIYVDHPVTGILTNNDPTDTIKPYYDFFLENGVLHENSESLVDFLNQVEPEVWWHTVIQKEMYKMFKNNYARSA